MGSSSTSVQGMPPENFQPTELISGDGVFNESGFEDFIKGGGAAPSLVVAIIGPQASGKSTLMNHLFGTNFRVMVAQNGRSKTTSGIWIAKAPHMKSSTVVLDLEGTDGRERGEDDAAFEKQSALFALAVSDVVIINMWCHDIGREHAANRPLLKTIFEVMLSMFVHHKTTLMFVARDKTKTPSELLERDLKKDVDKIWQEVPNHDQGTPLTEIFDVKVTMLAHYEFMRNGFIKEVDQLKLQLISHPKRNDTSKIGLSSAKKIWDMIKENKNLEVPPIRIMFATVRCEEIVMYKLRLLQSDQAWLDLRQKAQTQLVKCFGAQTSNILTEYLSQYDKESMYLESNVRKDKRQYFTSEALKVVRPALIKTLGHIRSKTMENFRAELIKASGGKICAAAVGTCRRTCVTDFHKQCSDHAFMKEATCQDDASTALQELLHDITEHALAQLHEQFSMTCNTQLLKVLEDGSMTDMWGSIRSLIKSECETAKSIADDIFGGEQEQVKRTVAELEEHARNMVMTNCKQVSDNVEQLMRKRFVIALCPMGSKAPVKKEAYRQCLDFLSRMAVIRLDETYDDVQRVLHSGLISGDKISTDALSSETWEKVPQQMTLITPNKCRDIWNKFRLEMELHLANEELYRKKHGKKWPLPTWAIVGLSILGVAALVALSIWCPGIAIKLCELAIVAAELTGIISMGVKAGTDYMYSDSKEPIKKDEILEKHPKIMENLNQVLKKTHESMITLHDMKKLSAATSA